MFESYVEYSHELIIVSSASIDIDAWILDSRCTMHATPNKSFFQSLNLCDDGIVMLGDLTTLPIKGIGNVPLRMHDGKIRVL